MKVINRHGETEEISFDEIKNRIKKLINFNSNNIQSLDHVDATDIAVNTIAKLFDGITTRQLDIESAKVCASLESIHHNYGLLGGRILSSDLYKHLKILKLETFSSRVDYIHKNLPKYLNNNYVNFIRDNYKELDNMINLDKNYYITFFGFKTLERSYLIKCNNDVIETPQDMFMRVAIAIHYRSNCDLKTILDNIKQTYDLTSSGYFTHATPTLFNAGTNFEQMSSCYLMGTDDSLINIFKTISDAALISKWAGGIGIHVSNIRAKGSKINSTNGESDGIIPMLKVYNETARYASQGGKRKGSIAIYLEPWHYDIEAFLELKKNTGAETERTRDLFTALWVCDEFMFRVDKDMDWYLMCPYDCPNLTETYGEEFSKLYNQYVDEKRYKKIIKAKTLFHKILESQTESGVPYILYKDNINRKSNQSNIGIVKSSNLCAEITEVSNKDEYAVCNLGSIAVNKFIKLDELKEINFDKYNEEKNLDDNAKLELQKLLVSIYDFDGLKDISRVLTRNLNNIIDYNYYPVPETKKSNTQHRPIGLGIQGLGDIYYILNVPYSSYVAKYIDALIMETIYFGSIHESSEISKEQGTYSTFKGSPASNGKFQFDLWKDENKFNYEKLYPHMYDWSDLKENVMKNGLSNSLLTALMPTATTSQILGNNECFEPYSSNIYKRTTLAGEFQVVNKHLVNKLSELKLWNENLRNAIIRNDGSIQNININNSNEFNKLKNVYKTVWEVKQKDIIDHSLARSPYVDQSQSMNLFFANPNINNMYSALMYGWKNGIKTGCYYLRSKPAVEATLISVSNSNSNNMTESMLCSIKNKEACTMCSS